MSRRGCGNPGCTGPPTGGRSPPPALPLQRGSLTPLHIAAALPGEAGVKITELLLHAVTDVDARAADQDDVHRLGKVRRLPPGAGGGGGRRAPWPSVAGVVQSTVSLLRHPSLTRSTWGPQTSLHPGGLCTLTRARESGALVGAGSSGHTRRMRGGVAGSAADPQSREEGHTLHRAHAVCELAPAGAHGPAWLGRWRVSGHLGEGLGDQDLTPLSAHS